MEESVDPENDGTLSESKSIYIKQGTSRKSLYFIDLYGKEEFLLPFLSL